ncbi:O-antigen ligase family protein [Sphingomonas cavernae]|nr:O-antigen ligase family protein [Sphingomonas cavernae]
MSLIVLRPVAVLACGFALLTLRSEHVANYRGVFAVLAVVFMLLVVELVPLPFALWSALPGREIVVEVDRLTGAGELWRPISMVPSATWNALYALFIPSAVVLLAAQLRREERFQILPIVIGLGAVSGVVGLLQVAGGSEGPLYFYRITNRDSAVGLFSNRNHAAVLLAVTFPMLAVYASSGAKTIEQARFRAWVAMVIGVVLLPLILVTGSRAGMVVAIVGIAAAAFLYRKPTFDRPAKRKIRRVNLAYVLGGFVVVGLALLFALFSRAKALERLLAPDQVEDLRFKIWGPIVEMMWKYFPVGSGIGTFSEVYQVDEPFSLLSPTYVNHAHNDWLELAMTGGVPALLVLLVVVCGFAIWSLSAWRTAGLQEGRDGKYARLASVILFILALSSLGDYPLRIPSLSALGALCAIWLCGIRTQNRGSADGPQK